MTNRSGTLVKNVTQTKLRGSASVVTPTLVLIIEQFIGIWICQEVGPNNHVDRFSLHLVP